MANELIINYPTGATLYALLFDGTGQIYNGSTFGAPGSASWTDYDIAMTEAATATGIYRATMPVVAAGIYSFVVRKQTGGSPAVSDTTIGTGKIEWSGTAEVSFASEFAALATDGEVAATLIAAMNAAPPAANVTLWKDATAPAMTGDAFARLGAPAGASVSADIAAIAAASAAGSGAISFPVTINDESSNPIDGVEVWVSTDSAGASVVAGTLHTSALGVATFMLDAGTYYLWRQKSGYNFTNPVTITVS